MNPLPVGLARSEPSRGQIGVMRVCVWHPTGAFRLEAADTLPTLRVDGGEELDPSAIVDHARRQLGLEVAFLRLAARDLAEVELLESGVALPRGFSWCPRPLTPANAERAPWERPGWVMGTLAAADDELARLGLKRTGRPVQVRHTSVTGMMRFPTDATPVWLKAVPPLFAHEAKVVRRLADLAKHEVPTVLSESDGWWLAPEFPPPARRPIGDPLVSLARTQIASVPYIEELKVIGCQDRLALTPAVAQLARRRDLLGSGLSSRLEGALLPLERTCEALDALGFPATLVHGDVSPGNVRWTDAGWLVYDWTDACVSHPFVELASPLSYERDESVVASRARAFAAVWNEVMPPPKVERALQAAPVVGAAHQSVNYGFIVDAIRGTGCDAAGRDRLAVFVRYWVKRLLSSLGH